MAYNTAHTLTSQGTASFKKQGFKNEYYFMIPNSFYKKSKHTNLISGCYITNIGYFLVLYTIIGSVLMVRKIMFSSTVLLVLV